MGVEQLEPFKWDVVEQQSPAIVRMLLEWLEAHQHYNFSSTSSIKLLSLNHALFDSVAAICACVVAAVLLVTSATFNSVLMINILRHARLRKSRVLQAQLNVCVCDVLRTCVLMPLSLVGIISQDWLFGTKLCYILPMLQQMLPNLCNLNFLVLAYEHLRGVQHAVAGVGAEWRRAPVASFIVGSWIMAFISMLPFGQFSLFINLSDILSEKLQGIGLCVVAQNARSFEIFRLIAIVGFVAPFIVSLYLYFRALTEESRLELFDDDDDDDEKNVVQIGNGHVRGTSRRNTNTHNNEELHTLQTSLDKSFSYDDEDRTSLDDLQMKLKNDNNKKQQQRQQQNNEITSNTDRLSNSTGNLVTTTIPMPSRELVLLEKHNDEISPSSSLMVMTTSREILLTQMLQRGRSKSVAPQSAANGTTMKSCEKSNNNNTEAVEMMNGTQAATATPPPTPTSHSEEKRAVTAARRDSTVLCSKFNRSSSVAPATTMLHLLMVPENNSLPIANGHHHHTQQHHKQRSQSLRRPSVTVTTPSPQATTIPAAAATASLLLPRQQQRNHSAAAIHTTFTIPPQQQIQQQQRPHSARSAHRYRNSLTARLQPAYGDKRCSVQVVAGRRPTSATLHNNSAALARRRMTTGQHLLPASSAAADGSALNFVGPIITTRREWLATNYGNYGNGSSSYGAVDVDSRRRRSHAFRNNSATTRRRHTHISTTSNGFPQQQRKYSSNVINGNTVAEEDDGEYVDEDDDDDILNDSISKQDCDINEDEDEDENSVAALPITKTLRPYMRITLVHGFAQIPINVLVIVTALIGHRQQRSSSSTSADDSASHTTAHHHQFSTTTPETGGGDFLTRGAQNSTGSGLSNTFLSILAGAADAAVIEALFLAFFLLTMCSAVIGPFLVLRVLVAHQQQRNLQKSAVQVHGWRALSLHDTALPRCCCGFHDVVVDFGGGKRCCNEPALKPPPPARLEPVTAGARNADACTHT